MRPSTWPQLADTAASGATCHLADSDTCPAQQLFPTVLLPLGSWSSARAQHRGSSPDVSALWQLTLQPPCAAQRQGWHSARQHAGPQHTLPEAAPCSYQRSRGWVSSPAPQAAVPEHPSPSAQLASHQLCPTPGQGGGFNRTGPAVCQPAGCTASGSAPGLLSLQPSTDVPSRHHEHLMQPMPAPGLAPQPQISLSEAHNGASTHGWARAAEAKHAQLKDRAHDALPRDSKEKDLLDS